MLSRLALSVANLGMILALGLMALTANGNGLTSWTFGFGQPGSDNCGPVDNSFLLSALQSDVGQANFEAQDEIDKKGVLTGYKLTVQIEGRSNVIATLPVESVFSGQIGALLV